MEAIYPVFEKNGNSNINSITKTDIMKKIRTFGSFLFLTGVLLIPSCNESVDTELPKDNRDRTLDL